MSALRTALTDRHFLRHLAEMTAAMLAGMFALGWIWPDLTGRVELMTLTMATDMTIGMAAVMVWRRHSAGSIVEMSLAMYAPFVVLFAPYWLGVMPAGLVYLLGHLLMLPAMVAAMLRRPEEYLSTGHCAVERAAAPDRAAILGG